MTWVKICGITNLEDALIAIEAGVDALGFVFYEKSPRHINVEAAREIVAKLPAAVEKVGVFVAEPNKRQMARRAGLGALQVHIGTYPIGAHPGAADDFAQASAADVGPRLKQYLAVQATAYVNYQQDEQNLAAETAGQSMPEIDALFLDSGSAQQPGGTGQAFDWLAAVPVVEKLNLCHNVVVAGGLTPANVNAAISLLKPWGVDVSSGVEARPGKKDADKVRAFVAAVRGTERVL